MATKEKGFEAAKRNCYSFIEIKKWKRWRFFVKISINTDEAVQVTEINITCNRLTPEIEKIISMLRMLDMQLTGKKEDETHIIDAAKVLYIETVDKKTFIYTKEEVYESELRLYELEERLLQAQFCRINKSCILNMKHIVSLKADFDRRIKVTMSNGEQLVISRQYAENMKKRLGVK